MSASITTQDDMTSGDNDGGFLLVESTTPLQDSLGSEEANPHHPHPRPDQAVSEPTDPHGGGQPAAEISVESSGGRHLLPSHPPASPQLPVPPAQLLQPHRQPVSSQGGKKPLSAARLSRHCIPALIILGIVLAFILPTSIVLMVVPRAHSPNVQQPTPLDPLDLHQELQELRGSLVSELMSSRQALAEVMDQMLQLKAQVAELKSHVTAEVLGEVLQLNALVSELQTNQHLQSSQMSQMSTAMTNHASETSVAKALIVEVQSNQVQARQMMVGVQASRMALEQQPCRPLTDMHLLDQHEGGRDHSSSSTGGEDDRGHSSTGGAANEHIDKASGIDCSNPSVTPDEIMAGLHHHGDVIGTAHLLGEEQITMAEGDSGDQPILEMERDVAFSPPMAEDTVHEGPPQDAALVGYDIYKGISMICRETMSIPYDMLSISGTLWASGHLLDRTLCIIITPVFLCFSLIFFLALVIYAFLAVFVVVLCMSLVVFLVVVCPYWLMQLLARKWGM